jgi:hypothetical protein
MSSTLSSINTAADTFQNWIDRTNSIITLLGSEVVTANAAGAVTSGNGFVNGYFGANTLVATNIKGGNVTTNSVITFQTNTTFSANVLVSQQLAVTNTVSFANTLAVTGNTALSNTLTVTGNVTLSNTLSIVGLANASGGLNTTTANTTAINVGANINLTTSTLNIGNTSINVSSNSSMIQIVGSNVVTESRLSDFTTQNTVTFTGNSSQVLDSMTLSAYRSAEYVISANNNTANAYQVSKILVIHDGTTAYVTEYGTMYTNTSVMTITAGANATHMLINCTPVSTNTTVKFTRFALGV